MKYAPSIPNLPRTPKAMSQLAKQMRERFSEQAERLKGLDETAQDSTRGYRGRVNEHVNEFSDTVMIGQHNNVEFVPFDGRVKQLRAYAAEKQHDLKNPGFYEMKQKDISDTVEFTSQGETVPGHMKIEELWSQPNKDGSVDKFKATLIINGVGEGLLKATSGHKSLGNQETVSDFVVLL